MSTRLCERCVLRNAPPQASPTLDLETPGEELSKAVAKKRTDGSTISGSESFVYSIPEELGRAARIVAGSTAPGKLDGERPRGHRGLSH